MTWSGVLKVHKDPQRFHMLWRTSIALMETSICWRQVPANSHHCLTKYTKEYLNFLVKKQPQTTPQLYSTQERFKNKHFPIYLMEKYSRGQQSPRGSVSCLPLSLQVVNASERGACRLAAAVRVDPELSLVPNMAALLPCAVSSVLDVQASPECTGTGTSWPIS